MSGGDVLTTDPPGADAEFLRSIISNATEGILSFDAAGRIVFANPAIEDILGYSPDELIGRSTTALVPERLRSAPGSDLQRLLEGDLDGVASLTVEFPARHRAGHEVAVSLDLWTHQYRGDHLATGTLGDVGDRKRREQSLREQNRELEEFAHVLSHDLRNPLVVADNHVESAREARDSEELRRVTEALDRLEQLIDDTLAGARGEEVVGAAEAVRLHAVARAAWDGVPTGDASLVVPDHGWRVRAHGGRLRQLTENLFRNAVEHGSTSPPSNAREDAVEHGGREVTVRVGILDGGTGIYVEDDGVGLPASVRARYDAGRGATRGGDRGFGLRIVGRIAEEHGWTMRLGESEAGGARFEFRGATVVGQ